MVLRQRFGWKNLGKKFAKQYITEANLADIQDIYKGYMTLSDADFKAIDPGELTEIQRSALVVADYFRELRSGLRDITTDPDTNKLIEKI